MEIDPETVRPMPGKVLIHVVEVLGGMTRGGIFVPGQVDHHAGKDTAYGRVLSVGGAPRTRTVRDEHGTASIDEYGPEWPSEYRVVAEGDVVVFPRDVPLAFSWGEDRYAIVLEAEAIVSIPGEEFSAAGFQVVPWRPAPLPGADPGEDQALDDEVSELVEGD